MRLEKLAFVFGPHSELPLSTLQRPFFRCVTHLDLYLQGGADDPALPLWHEWSHLASLPALSHLSLSRRLHNNVLPQAVAACPRLSVAVAAFWESHEGGDAAEFARLCTIRDPRFVVMVVPNYEADWKTGARGGADFWVRAEEFIALKRRGEIEAACHLLEERI
ncbi:hypothetical protein C8R47DRAFT_167150 [Mycena vitilis]|nr:hypothetical protein C8R47DRAFT_167150 [Mycena vitilis]